ncbi:TPA: type VI secretion system ATPase TssH [Burkholderia territorii]|uniref:type VI secretion system ATPase TssH n=1 Tax=Burkholderia territorii TaxID=1503055 RepID=UPI0011C79753|nr:type VI secretion system ATPase TssH [Burkholderia territorii]TXG03729.1 type VI secretion system ATPase TssH [Burkholderia territorii]HDR8858632.1 type VI secretion system ATPase TssH [Burkholderia territorii]HDR8866300.1 type VI secretion system ATPase TssH [Burkholderia territorii]HDR8872716.1 type VI secretion system ATPase TssH [Burkholderia territorii]HDR8879116.1 type VI secretion system ATPase TssH [Burkholderia territorii]
MTPRDTTHLLRRLNPHCAKALEAAVSLCQTRLADEITVEHWLLKLIQAGDGDIPAILLHYGINIDTVWDALIAAIEHLPRNLRGKPALSPQLATMLQDAWMYASSETDEATIRSGNLLQAIVDTPHVLRAQNAWPLLSVSSAQVQRLLPRLAHQSCESPMGEGAEAGTDDNATVPAGADTQERGARVATPPSTSAPQRTTESDALARFAIDLTDKARRGDIDPVFGRDREIQQMVDVLARRRKNNPILVGEPGVGKTALVEGLALRVAEGSVPDVIRDVRILTLDLGLLQAGAGVKGEFEQRLKNVIDEVQASPTPILLFIDEAHTLIGAGNAAGGADAANLLKPALARGELRTIAATTWSEYKEFFERDAALERRFQIIKVDEPDDDAACLMLRGLKSRYAKYHHVHIRDEALVAAVRLSRRYIPARQLPDKAVDLIDTAAARVRIGLESPPAELQRARAAVSALELELAALDADARAGIDDVAVRRAALESGLTEARNVLASLQARYISELELVNLVHQNRAEISESSVTPNRDPLDDAKLRLAERQGKTPLVFVDVDASAIARVVAEWTGVPVGNLMEDELQSLLTLEQQLAKRVVAQDDALAALAESLRTAKAGLKNEQAPLGVFLLAGPSGVGKTETALALADLLFGGEAALTTINMSEYQESHTVSQLKGSPPGYVGYGRGGILTEAVRQRPYGVVLLDEIEKAHRDVLDIFYQVFDRGTMRDGEGREIDFRNCVILMTSNLGSARIDEVTADNPEIAQTELLEAIHPQLVAHFQPALLARFQTLVYRPLDAVALGSIVRLKLAKVAERLRRQHDVELACDESLIVAMAKLCLARESGARNVDAFLNQRILPTISRELLARMAAGLVPAKIVLSSSVEGNLTIDFIDRDDVATGTAEPASVAV